MKIMEVAGIAVAGVAALGLLVGGINANFNGGKVTRAVNELLAYQFGDTRVAGMQITSVACRFELPPVVKAVLDQYVKARGDVWQSIMTSERNKLLGNPLLLAAICPTATLAVAEYAEKIGKM